MPNEYFIKLCSLENNCTYNDPMGRSYMGKKYRTVGNRVCADWSSQRAYEPSEFPDGSYDGASNYCRNPRPYEDRTWCYWNGRQWDYCILRNCGKWVILMLTLWYYTVSYCHVIISLCCSLWCHFCCFFLCWTCSYNLLILFCENVFFSFPVNVICVPYDSMFLNLM